MKCPFCGYVEETEPEQPHYLRPGTILANHFIVGTVIGAGGFGITYRCYDTTLGVIVAVKEFFPVGLVNRANGHKKVGLLSGEKEKKFEIQKKRFLIEAQSIVRFGKAKDIVNVYDYFEENNTAYIIMEYIEGTLLKDELAQKGKMDVKAAFQVIEPIIEAVKKIHAQGIVHRDISPDNIFVLKDGTIKVFDFGAAKLSDVAEGEKVIKVGYSAPEQYRDSSKQGYFTDVYSIGAILYQMLTGVKPIESTQREYKDELQSPMELGVSIDSNLDRTVMEALAVQPELRFQGVQQLDDAIHGKRMAVYPREKIKRENRKRNWIITCSLLIVVFLIVVVALFQTVLKEKNTMFEENLKKDTLTIWVDSKDKRDMLSDVSDSFSEVSTNDSDAIVQMKKENEGIKITIRDITESAPKGQKKYGDMEQALDAAISGEEKFPDIFVSDNVSDLSKYKLESYKDNVCQNIDTKEYLYFSPYQKYFSDMKEMPISFDVLMFYGIDIDNGDVTDSMRNNYKKSNVISSSLLNQGKTGTIELSKIVQANTSGQEHTYLDSRAVVLSSILQSQSGFDYKKGVFTFKNGMIDTMNRFLNIRQSTMKSLKWKTEKDTTPMYGNSVLAGAGYRSQLYQAKIRKISTAIPYKVLVPTVDGKMLVQYDCKLAISAKSSKNKRLAAMRFVYFALGQQQCAADKDTAFPVSDVTFQNASGENTSGFEEFFSINSSQQVVEKLIKDKSFPCLLIAKGSGRITNLSKGIVQKKINSKKALQGYCDAFEKKQEE